MLDNAPADAVLIPKAMAGGGDYRQKLIRIAAIARPLMGLGKGDEFNVPVPPHGDEYFVRKGKHNNADSLLFPIDHDRAGEPRYEWTDRGDGVKLGRLRPDPEPAPAPAE